MSDATASTGGSMVGKTVIVTGGNSGIGKATAVALARAGARVVITARDQARGDRAVEDIRRASGSDRVELVVFDLGDLASVRAGAAEILERCPRIDVLVNNAGLVLTDRAETVDGYEATFAINHLGPFLLTNLLPDRLMASAPARIVNVASTAHNPGPPGHALRRSAVDARTTRACGSTASPKLANILFTTELARRLAGKGVTANSLHPGTVRTGYGRDGDTKGFLAFGIKIGQAVLPVPGEGGRTSVYLASSPEVAGVTGEYFVKCKARRRPSAGPGRSGRSDSGRSAKNWSVPRSRDLLRFCARFAYPESSPPGGSPGPRAGAGEVGGERGPGGRDDRRVGDGEAELAVGIQG